jgi:hypothetical protein
VMSNIVSLGYSLVMNISFPIFVSEYIHTGVATVRSGLKCRPTALAYTAKLTHIHRLTAAQVRTLHMNIVNVKL